MQAITGLFISTGTEGCIYSSCAPSTGFNPRWDCTLSFQLQVPELALVRFMVEDHDHTAKNDFVGQFTLPFTSLRTGECDKWMHLLHNSAKKRHVVHNVCTAFSLLRLPTRPLTEGRWVKAVPCHTLYPRQSDPQRSSRQNGVRTHGGCQRQGMTFTGTREGAAFFSCECEERGGCTAASWSFHPDLNWKWSRKKVFGDDEVNMVVNESTQSALWQQLQGNVYEERSQCRSSALLF